MSQDEKVTHRVSSVQKVIDFALRVGWSACYTGKQSEHRDVLLVAPQNRKVIEIPGPVRQWNQSKLDGMVRTVCTYGKGPLSQRIEVPPEVTERVAAKPSPPEPTRTANCAAPLTLIAEERRTRYIERLWSDGSTDFACLQCDYSSKVPYGFGPHVRVHRRAAADKLAALSPVPAPSAPVSAEETLAQIRAVLGLGDGAAALQAENERLRAELAEANGKLSQLQSILGGAP